MEKISLPIDIETKDTIKPSKPDFSWLFRMLIVFFIIVIIIYSIFITISALLVNYLTIEQEKNIFGKIVGTFTNTLEEFNYENLENKIDIDPNYTIFISDSMEVNGYATIGANIIINRGLIENLKYEEELLFILGHEKAHINNRDIIKSVFRDMPLTFILSMLGFDVDFKITSLNKIIENYSNQKSELLADNGGLEYINGLGLNLGCSINFFKNTNDDFTKYLNFISTHPSNQERIKNLEKQILYPNKDCTILDYFK